MYRYPVSYMLTFFSPMFPSCIRIRILILIMIQKGNFTRI